MKNTLRELLKSCLRDAKSGKGGLDPNKYPSQVATLVFMMTVACTYHIHNLNTFNECCIEIAALLWSAT